ncbi:PqiC family protein [Desulfoluna butyratoxydans]|uniref:Abc-type transport auxiliary lipoprotein component n=1 Tax=Desulfoluna butyratoxydans TaxID=231438 RepID=A0A4U8YLL6_9BACT|nr:PqiC family protein [Desulfoluna butyratoxydans]VFQ44467.1 abc-type transport auxiliary lipoprotein component [Desulfoluna butyratoxydans]
MPKTVNLIVVGAFLLMAGCASSSAVVTYHLLHPVAAPVEAGHWDPSTYVVVGPVELPSYLDRPQMVSRRSDHTLSVNEYQRWAEPLDEGIARTVAENLSQLTGGEKMFLYPFDAPKASATMQVFMDVVRFDTDEAGKAVLDVRWGLKNGKRETLLTRHTSLSGVVDGEDQPARARALSRLVAEFSRDVARTLVNPE